MLKFKIKIVISVVFFLIVISSSSQTYVDSIKQVIQSANHDTVLIQSYIKLCDYYKATNADTSLFYNNLAEKIADKLSGNDAELLKGEVVRIKGVIYYYLSDYNKALSFFQKAEKNALKNVNKTDVKTQFKAKKLHAVCLGNIGLIYHELGNYAKALDYYFKALKINSEVGNKKDQSANLGNIGVLYSDQGNYAKALDYYKKALNISQEIGDKSYLASDYGNIATVYHRLGEYDKAIDYYLKALSIDKEIQNKNGVARHMGNLGSIYAEKGNYKKALDYYFKALELCKESGNVAGQAINLGNIGNLYFSVKQYDKAEKYLKKAEKINEELGTLYYLKSNTKKLSQLYEIQKKHKNALNYFKEYIKIKDSLNSNENRKAYQTIELKYQYEKEQAIKEQEHQKQLEVEKKEKEKQETISYFTAGGLSIVLIFSILLYNRLQLTRKQKDVIEQQKSIVEQQSQIVKEKNKEITDSIQYAKRIQTAILPPEKLIKKHLPNSFILYKPKDIVSGDFYWLESDSNLVFFAVADCTGHGVPGAMVSVVCSNVLSKSVIEEKIYLTDKILNRAKALIIERFARSGHNISDGMDISLCCLNTDTLELNWSGANNPLYIYREKELIELKPDKQPIGKSPKHAPFTRHTVQLQKGDALYLFTDGFADQFGGEKGKKLKYKPFKELLLSIQDLPMEEQKTRLENFFNEWKGNLEQVDDVCIFGVKV